MDWNKNRIKAIRLDLKNAMAQEKFPVKLLRKRFRKGVNKKKLTPEACNEIAEIWNVWGILEAMKIFQNHQCFNNVYNKPVNIMNKALHLCSDKKLEANIIFNIGACYLLEVLWCDPGIHLASQIGLLNPSVINFKICTGNKNLKKIKLASDLFFRANNISHITTGSRYLACLLACAYGTLAISEPVRKRIHYIQKAKEKINQKNQGEISLLKITSSVFTHLNSLPAIKKIFGKDKTILAESNYFNHIQLNSVFIYPEKLFNYLTSNNNELKP